MSDHDLLNQGARPLAGVVLCCTSIPPEQRSELDGIARTLGAVHKLDLTSDVTHLIAGNTDTPKYKYVAKERQDIKVLQPDWLYAVHSLWIEAEEADVSSLEEQYRLPTFSGLQICVTGFDDVAQRSHIQDTVTKNGASYHGDLTKSITHLIAAAPTGRKYQYAGAWGTKIVSLEWLGHSIERGMVLDEALYHPLVPLESRGKGAVTQRRAPSPHLGKHPREATTALNPDGSNRRKLRRTASTRLESQNDALWADIGSADAQKPGNADCDSQNEAPARDVQAVSNTDIDSDQVSANPSLINTGIFSEDSRAVKIFVHGFDQRKTRLLHQHLSSAGADVLSADDMRRRNNDETSDQEASNVGVKIVIPHDTIVADFGYLYEESIANSEDSFVTEWWIEKCLHKKRLIRPQEEPLCEPFADFPIPGFEKLTICPTSFSGIDLLLFSKAVRLVGASYDEVLRKDTSILVCHEASANPGKLRYALENQIPVVSGQWLYDSIDQGRMQSIEDYALSATRKSQKPSQTCFYHPILNPRPRPQTHISSRHRKDKPISQQKRRLDLSRPPESDTTSGHREDSIGNEDAPTRPLQDLSPSKQNSQSSESVNTRHTSNIEEAGPHKDTSRNYNLGSNQTDLTGLQLSQCSHAGDKFESDEIPRQDSNISASGSVVQNPNNSEADLSIAPPQEQASEQASSNSLKPAIAALLAHQQKTSASRPSSASAHSEPQPPPRRQRTLGRAPSNGSTAISRPISFDRRAGGGTASEPALIPTEDDEMFNARGGAGEGEVRAGFRPSQALSYEDPEGKAMRDKMLAKAGHGGDGALALDGLDEGRARGQRVESIGVVKDAGPAEDKRRRGMRRK